MKTIDIKIIYEFLNTIVSHPRGEICVHNVCITLISAMERSGYVLSEDEIKLVHSLCDCSAGDEESNRLLTKLIGEQQ